MVETDLHGLARHTRDVLDCAGAGILLECSDPTLRHPLLNFLPPMSAYYSGDFVPIAASERLAAVCDMVLQSGRRLLIERLPLYNGAPGSVVAVPLERPSGLLGLLLLFVYRSGAFGPDESCILDQYVPFVARWLEELLVDFCALPLDQPTESQPLGESEPSVFVSLVSHEMRVPLSAIKGYAVLLQTYSGVDDAARMTISQRRQYLEAIMQQAGHLEVLVDDLLDVSRLRTGSVTLRCEHIDIAQMCRDVACLIQDRAEQTHPGCYYIRCVIDPQLSYAWADRDRVQQVLTNLVENAIKYSPGGGQIEIIARARRTVAPLTQQLADGRMARACWKTYITVRDWGIGIPGQMQSSLFKPFQRLEHPLTTHVAGNGLGLYIARQLVEAMGGQIVLTSGEGQGTSVTFALPAEPMQSAEIRDAGLSGGRELRSLH